MDQIVVTAILSAFMAVLGFVGSRHVDRYENFEEKVRVTLDQIDRRICNLERESATKAELQAAVRQVYKEVTRMVTAHTAATENKDIER